MPIRLQLELEKLKKLIMELGATVEQRVGLAVKAVQERNADLGQSVIDGDREVDALEVELEEECLKLLALHQPVATDLRYIVSILKINNDIERVGDLAVNIAGRGVSMASISSEVFQELPCPFDLPLMAQKVRDMLHMSLESLCFLDPERALNVRLADNDVDNINRAMYHAIQEKLTTHPEHSGVLLQYMSVSKYLERVADHATNIAEDVIYLCSGRIIRHRFFDTGRN